MPPKKTPAAAPVLSASTDLYLMDIPTAAARLSTTIFAVRAAIRSGKLRYVAIGHKMLLSPKAIEEFIQASEMYYPSRPR